MDAVPSGVSNHDELTTTKEVISVTATGDDKEPIVIRKQDIEPEKQEVIIVPGQESTRTCPKCGNATRPDAAFCSHCGASFNVARTCTKCGFFNRSGAVFCGRCGRPLNDVPRNQ